MRNFKKIKPLGAKRVLTLVLALLAVCALFAGCSTNSKPNKPETSLNVPQPKPLTEAQITLVALQVSIPEGTPYSGHKIDYELYEEVVDENSQTSLVIKDSDGFDAEEYSKYSAKVNLEDAKISDAAVEKIVLSIYGEDNYLFKFGGQTQVKLTDGRYGILKTVIVQPFDGNKKESFQVLLTGKEAKTEEE